MIIRILGEGQFTVDEADVASLNKLDSSVERAIEAKDEAAFAASLVALHDAVRAAGTPVPDVDLVDSQLILPPADASLEEVAELLGDDGLIPG